jgi:hypothetical protein
MSKNYISEERLKQLIQESITEVLKEEEFDENAAHWLGRTFQGIRNKWNNFKADFNAGRNKARYDNRDYDPFEPFGDEADEIRNFGGREYGTYRYNQAIERNNNARQYDRTINRNNSQNTDMAPHPGLNNNQEQQPETPVEQQPETPAQQPETPAQQPETPAQQQPETPVEQQPETPAQQPETPAQQPKPKSKREELQARINSGNYPKKQESWVRTTEPSDAAYGRQMAIRNLERAGIVPQNGDWNKRPLHLKNVKGGGLTEPQKKIILTYNKFLYEEKLKELNKKLNEIKTIRLKKK